MKKMSKKMYETPRVEVIAVEVQGVLCTSSSSSLGGNATESVPSTGFDIP